MTPIVVPTVLVLMPDLDPHPDPDSNPAPLARALQDADECIRLAPDFAKGYSRKGHLQYFMKEYEKALETYDTGLKHDPGNSELKEGRQRTMQAVAQVQGSARSLSRKACLAGVWVSLSVCSVTCCVQASESRGPAPSRNYGGRQGFLFRDDGY